MRLFFLDFNKEGPGVSKNAPPKEGLALLWDIFAREFTSLLKLNLIFLVSCIPIITIGASIGAMTAVTIRMVKDEPSDLLYDFKEAFKKNWKSSILIFASVVIIAIVFVKLIIFFMISEGIIYNILISILLVTSFLVGISCIYIYPMSVSVNLPLSIIIKNSFLLSIAQIRYSFPTFLLCLALLESSILLFPYSIPIILLCTFSFISFLSSFCAWNGIKKHIIKYDKVSNTNS